jgi:hypothetical protein
VDWVRRLAFGFTGSSKEQGKPRGGCQCNALAEKFFMGDGSKSGMFLSA